MNALTITDLDVFYGEFQALYGVSLQVGVGETVAIIGANGAGKTTLLRTVAGALEPMRGEIVYRESSIVGQPAYALSKCGIALVPEGRRIFPSLSVKENLTLGAFGGRKGEWSLAKVYELFPVLRDRANMAGIDMSGGEQQMLAIGRALMSNPDLILMDEISLGLAPVIVKEMYRVVRSIASQGTTVVIVEQDVTRSLQVADRVYCLLEGKVSLEGVPGELERSDISKAYFGV